MPNSTRWTLLPRESHITLSLELYVSRLLKIDKNLQNLHARVLLILNIAKKKKSSFANILEGGKICRDVHLHIERNAVKPTFAI